MGQVTQSQQWGAGTLPGTVGLKGGWGPDPDGGYFVRQLAIIRPRGGGQIAIAIAARPSDGEFATGVRNLDQVARWAQSNLTGAQPLSC